MTPDGNFDSEEWAACATAALAQLQDEIDAAPAAARQAFADALRRTLGEPATGVDCAGEVAAQDRAPAD
jgi:hypothetical protein